MGVKIEIELSEVEWMRNRIQALEKERDELSGRIDELDLKKLESKAIDLSKILFEKYMSVTFQKLGFDNKDGNAVEFGYLEQYLGKSWWEVHDKLEAVLSAKITEKFRTAFMTFKVLPEDKGGGKKEGNLLDTV